VNRIFKILLIGTTLVFPCLSLLAEDRAEAFKDGDRVCFIGDSITHSGYYWEYIGDWYATRHPELNLEIFNCGFSGGNLGGALRSLDHDVLENKPTKAVVMFGMNDVGRDFFFKDDDSSMTAAEKENAIKWRTKGIETYEQHLRMLLENLKKAGVKVTILSPTHYDQTVQVKAISRFGANDGLSKFTEICRKLSEEYKTGFVDLHTPMTKLNEELQKADPSASLIGPDRIHPTKTGHWVMAYLFLKAQNVDSMVSSVSADAVTKKITAAKNCTAEFLNGDDSSLSFKFTAATLPLPMVDVAADVDKIIPLASSLSRETLSVSGLSEGDYDVTLSSKDITKSMGCFSNAQLAKGIEIGTSPLSPAQSQAKNVAALLRERADIVRAFRDVASVDTWVLDEMVAKGTLEDTEAARLAFVKTKLEDDIKRKSGWGCFLDKQYLENIPKRNELKAKMAQLAADAKKAAIPMEMVISIKKRTVAATNGNSDVVLQFNFDEGKGQLLSDKSGKGNDGILGKTEAEEGEDPGWVKVDDSHQALSFDGVYNNRVTVKNAQSLCPLDRLSISAHIKRSMEQPGGIVNKGFSTYCVFINRYGSLGFQYRDGANEVHQTDSRKPLPINQWLNVEVIADASSKTVEFIVDGEKIATQSLIGNGFFKKDTAPIEVGYSSAQKYPFAGLIDKLVIRNSEAPLQR
jgi:lysophospholipase L1-like esterase